MSDDLHKLLAERYAALMAAVRDANGHTRSEEEQRYLLDQLRSAMDRAADRLAPSPTGLIADTFIRQDVIESGEWHDVLKLRHRDLGTFYALKTLKPAHAALASRANLLRREAQLGLGLAHPRIAQTRLLLRLADGRPGLLQDWAGAPLNSFSHFTTQQCDSIVTGVLSALTYLNGMRLMHGDIAPGNILLDEEGNVRLCDFGLALAFGETHAALGLAEAKPAWQQQGDSENALTDEEQIKVETIPNQPASALQDLHGAGHVFRYLMDHMDGQDDDMTTGAMPQSVMRQKLEMLADFLLQATEENGHSAMQALLNFSQNLSA